MTTATAARVFPTDLLCALHSAADVRASVDAAFIKAEKALAHFSGAYARTGSDVALRAVERSAARMTWCEMRRAEMNAGYRWWH